MYSTYYWYDFVGNVGVALILAAYWGLQARKLTSQSWAYSTANALGALLILVSLYFDFNLSAFLMEACWLVISLYGLSQYKVQTPGDTGSSR